MIVDVLVIGSGLAGTAAALEAAAQGARVALVGSGPGASHLAQGGLAAAVGSDDSTTLHARDTLQAGAGACDPAAVFELTAEAPAAVDWLQRQGVHFDQLPDGRLATGLEAAHSRQRIVHVGDRTGAAIMAALEARLRESSAGVIRLDRHPLIGLLATGRACFGGGFRGPRGRIRVEAAATVVATGGFAGLYGRSVSPSTGAGLLAALYAGAELADLEFVQFHPTAYAGPGPSFLLTEALRGAGARITDRRGHAFLAGVDPRAELAPRSVVARALAEHLGRAGESFALLDARPLGAALERDFPGFMSACRQVGLDPRLDPVPIAPAAHYTMGGIVTDLEARTRVKGLLAIGECARTGVHGANRLASNSLLEAVVMGRRAARSAATWQSTPANGHRVQEEEIQLGDTPQSRRLLSDQVGLVRSPGGLEQAVARLQGLPALVAAAALGRPESRGAHYRSDAPSDTAAWANLEVRAYLGPDRRPRVESTERVSHPSGADSPVAPRSADPYP